MPVLHSSQIGSAVTTGYFLRPYSFIASSILPLQVQAASVHMESGLPEKS
jgi:hypothetical protein